MHLTSEARFKELLIPEFVTGMRVLEIGPDNIPSTYYRHLQAAGIDVEWWFCELDDTGTAIYELNERRIPLLGPYRIDCPDEHFNVVFHGQVLEHVPRIWEFVVETARVLAPEGKMLMINPAQWPHHEPAPDCWRIFPEGIRALLDEADLRCEFSELFQYEDGTADTVSIGVKVAT